MSRSLYGGAITASIPSRFIDVSKFRLVADNQEVLADIDSDQSVIIELLSLVEDVSNENCAEFHFGELAKENEATDCSSIWINRLLANEELPNLSCPTIHKAVVIGNQKISKFNEQAKNDVDIYMAIIRVPHITTDILITFNSPKNINQDSSSAKNIQTQIDQVQTAKIFEEILRTFKILDWSLFL